MKTKALFFVKILLINIFKPDNPLPTMSQEPLEFLQ